MIENSLKALRLERDLTQQKLADLLGVNRQTVIAIENGKYRPSVELALQMAKLFRLPVEKVFKLKD